MSKYTGYSIPGLDLIVRPNGIRAIAINPRTLNGDSPLKLVLKALYAQDENLELPDYEKLEFDCRRLVIERLIKKKFDSKLKVTRLTGWIRQLVEAEVNLWLVTLEMLKELNVLTDTLHPALSLLAMVSEHSLLMCWHLDRDALEGIRGKEKLIDRWQRENKLLQELENPFEKRTSPHTYSLWEKAIELADRNDSFRKKYITPVRDARMALTKVLKDNPEVKLHVKGQAIRQGMSIAKLTTPKNTSF